MTAALDTPVTVSEDELLVLADRMGIPHFPVVLGVRPRHAALDEQTAALDRATRQLMQRELIRDGEVDADLAPLLHALQRPDRELAMRLVTADGIARYSLIRRGRRGLLARRVRDEITVRIIPGDGELSEITRALVAELPRAEAAQITPVGAPLEAMSRQLAGTHDATALADRIRALGADAKAALLLGSALASRAAFAEIVYRALSAEDDRIIRQPAAVGIFYTKRGRIVGASSVSPSGQLWTTLKPGSDHAIGQAIRQLLEVSGEGWRDSSA